MDSDHALHVRLERLADGQWCASVPRLGIVHCGSDPVAVCEVAASRRRELIGLLKLGGFALPYDPALPAPASRVERKAGTTAARGNGARSHG